MSEKDPAIAAANPLGLDSSLYLSTPAPVPTQPAASPGPQSSPCSFPCSPERGKMSEKDPAIAAANPLGLDSSLYLSTPAPVPTQPAASPGPQSSPCSLPCSPGSTFIHLEDISSLLMIRWVRQQEVKVRTKRDLSQNFTDPYFPQQWYLNGGADGGLDMKVAPAWAKGYTGKNVVVTILDDGIQTNHPDLADNYDAEASSDVNDNDPDPTPRNNGDNKHGTRCAGEVAAIAFNSYCGIGIAYNASIGGVRMLDGTVSDAVEARALSLNPDHVQIYSASWGPEDDGRTVDGPGPLATRAILRGVTTGRGGKGSIFVWASGNGGTHTDSCSCDGYTNSVYTLSISSTTQAGLKPWYLEECPSTLATTYSSGILGSHKSILTTDMDPELRRERLCTTEHTGTSASAPLAAGLCALALEANPDLTWRDMQHLVVMTADPGPLEAEPGWITNAAKRRVSHKFGFGLMNGGAMVDLAERWTTVPDQHICETQVIEENREINAAFRSETVVTTNVTSCPQVSYLEHVQALLTVSLRPRGNLRLELTSPGGTPSVLLEPRPRDVSASAFDSWPFLSVHFWGEDPRGVWTLRVLNAGYERTTEKGLLKKWKLIFYGTDLNPVRLKPPSLEVFHNEAIDNIIKEANSTIDNIIKEERDLVFKCHKECDKSGCYGSLDTDCVYCRHYRMNGSCVSECGEGHFAAGGDCSPCHRECATCTGPGKDSCLTCAPPHYHVTDLGICIHSCPHTYHQDEEKRLCVSCCEACETCQDTPESCTSCEPHLVSYNGSCLPSCPPGTRQDINQSCVKNELLNVTCGGNLFEDCNNTQTEFCNTTSCTNCTQEKQNFTCTAACDSGWYEGEDGDCSKCWPGCSSCYGGRRDECTSCVEEWTLARGQCLRHCPRDMFSAPHGCQPCHHFCSTCNGGGPYSCTSCSKQRYLDDSTGLCYSCDLSCSSCIGPGPGNCSSCSKGRLLHSGSCLPSQARKRLLHHHASGGARKVSSIDKRRSKELDPPNDPSQHQQYLPAPEYSPVVIVTVIAIVASLAIIVLFALLFATLQVR